MLDAIKKAAAEFLGATITQVREAREALHAEVATEEGRYAARTQLTHPKGSTTPLNSAADRAQQTFEKARAALYAELPKVLSLMLAHDVAAQRRDEARDARDKHWDAEMTRRATGVHPKVDEYFRRLFTHGVTPHNLAQHRDEDVAIMADLHRWKAKDPLYKDPDNPWRGIYGIYANRMIAVPGGGRTVTRSVPGTPVRTRRYAPDKWYMFNEVAAGLGATPVHTAAAVPVASVPMPTTPSVSQTCPAPVAVAPVDEAISPGPSKVEVIPPPAPIAPTAADQQAAVEVTSTPDLASTEKHAREMAETIYARNPVKLSIYWPRQGVDLDDFTPETLIPALERWINSGTAWSGAERFLTAAREGRAREFIQNQRQSGIRHLTIQLLAGDERAIAEARNAGCRIELLAIGQPPQV